MRCLSTTGPTDLCHPVTIAGPAIALWLAATNDQWPPELDIMEHWYSEQDYKIYDHW